MLAWLVAGVPAAAWRTCQRERLGGLDHHPMQVGEVTENCALQLEVAALICKQLQRAGSTSLQVQCFLKRAAGLRVGIISATIIKKHALDRAALAITVYEFVIQYVYCNPITALQQPVEVVHESLLRVRIKRID